MQTTGRFQYLEALPGGASSPDQATSVAQRPRGTLVLIHGFPLGAGMWEPQLELASHGWRVIAPQLRGYGGQTAQSVATSVDDYAGDVIDLLDALDIEDAVIGGLSMGGYIVFAMFRHAPRYFRGLILADTRAEADTPEGVSGRTRMLQLLRERGPAAIADDLMPKLVSESTRTRRPEVVTGLHNLIVSNSSETIAGSITALMTRPDATPLLRQIHCPTLIVVGEEDALTPPALSQDLQRGISGSELVIVPGAGHMSNLEQPAAFNHALAHFLGHRV